MDCAPDFTCTKCSSSFIERISPSEQGESAEEMEDGISIAINHNPASGPRPPRSGMRRTRISIHRRPGAEQHENLIQGFFHHFINGLLGSNETQSGPINIQVSPFSINFEDFFINRDGLDNIITMFMNQMEHTGPPPASKEDIKSLPLVKIKQEHTDNKLQCHVCMEDFILDEEVTSLPCNHVYHTGCIVPWLELHATCPICRMTIGAGNGTQQSQGMARSSSASNLASPRSTSRPNRADQYQDDFNLD